MPDDRPPIPGKRITSLNLGRPKAAALPSLDKEEGINTGLSPTALTRRALRTSSGVSSVTYDRNKRAKRTDDQNDTLEQLDNPYKKGRPNRRENRRRTSEGKRLATNLAKSAINSKGNMAKFAWDNQKVIRDLLRKYYLELFFAILGDLCDAIPLVGIVLNACCWFIVYLLFKMKGIDFIGRVTKGSLGIMNILAEIIVGALAFWPGLTFGVIQTILTADADK